MSTFSQLKSYPFFREISNWFYPFDKQQSDVIKEFRHRGKEGGSLLEIILQSGFFCNSDKYSLFFTMQQLPQSQRDMMLNQLTDQQIEELADQSKAETLKKFSERPDTVSTNICTICTASLNSMPGDWNFVTYSKRPSPLQRTGFDRYSIQSGSHGSHS